MAKSTGATVIAPDYRRAPQNQFPGPFDDCLAGSNSKFREVDTCGMLHAHFYAWTRQTLPLALSKLGRIMVCKLQAVIHGHFEKRINLPRRRLLSHR